jgi:hypothetical protein
VKTTPSNIHPHMTGVAKSAGHGKGTTAHVEPMVPGKKANSKVAKGMKKDKDGDGC